MRVQIEQICVQYDYNKKYLVHGTRAGTIINRLFRTVHTSSISQWDHRDFGTDRLKDESTKAIEQFCNFKTSSTFFTSLQLKFCNIAGADIQTSSKF